MDIRKSSMKPRGDYFSLKTPAYTPAKIRELEANSNAGIIFAPRQQGILLNWRNEILRNAPLCRKFSHKDQYLSVNNINNNSETYNRHLEASFDRGCKLVKAGKALDKKTYTWLRTLEKDCSSIVLRHIKYTAESKIVKLHEEFEAWFRDKVMAEFKNGELRKAGFNKGNARFYVTRYERSKYHLATFEEENKRDLAKILKALTLSKDENDNHDGEQLPNNSIDTTTSARASAELTKTTPACKPLPPAPLKSRSTVQGQPFTRLDDFLTYTTTTTGETEAEREVELETQRLITLQRQWQLRLNTYANAKIPYNAYGAVFRRLAHELAAQFKAEVESAPLIVINEHRYAVHGRLDFYNIQRLILRGFMIHGFVRTDSDFVLVTSNRVKGSPACHSVEFKGRIVAEHSGKIRDAVDKLLPKLKKKVVSFPEPPLSRESVSIEQEDGPKQIQSLDGILSEKKRRKRDFEEFRERKDVEG